jgi:hypothetical protein
MTMPFNDNHKPNGERGGEMPRLLYIRLFLWAVIFWPVANRHSAKHRVHETHGHQTFWAW